MQGLIRKLVAQVQAQHPLRNTNSHHRIFNTHSAFSSVPKPSQPQLHQKEALVFAYSTEKQYKDTE